MSTCLISGGNYNVWVVGSRKYKDFEEYLVDKETFNTLKIESALPIVGNRSFNEFIKTRIDVLTEFLEEVNTLAGHGELEDATVNGERSTGQAPWYLCRPKGRVQAALAPCLLVLDALYISE